MLILWSGGFDSTCVLVTLAKEHFRPETPELPTAPFWLPNPPRAVPDRFGDYGFKPEDKTDHSVRALSINHSQVAAKSEHRQARLTIRSWFAKQQDLQQPSFGEISLLQDDICCGWWEGFGLVQPQLWLAHAVPALGENEDLYVGYIKGDCLWQYYSQYIDIFYKMQELRHGKGKIQFPLAGMEKGDVIKVIRSWSLEDSCWYCEAPERHGVPCGRCGSCRTHDRAKLYLDHGDMPPIPKGEPVSNGAR